MMLTSNATVMPGLGPGIHELVLRTRYPLSRPFKTKRPGNRLPGRSRQTLKERQFFTVSSRKKRPSGF